METVDVQVTVFDRGETKQPVVQVPISAFDPASLCWKTTAALAAAVELGISFTQVERAARYGLRREDRARLREMYGGTGDADCHGLRPRNDNEGGTGNAERV